jgi:hypothetical protein
MRNNKVYRHVSLYDVSAVDFNVVLTFQQLMSLPLSISFTSHICPTLPVTDRVIVLNRRNKMTKMKKWYTFFSRFRTKTR